MGFMFSLVHSSHISGKRCVRYFRKKLEHEEFKNWEKAQIESEVGNETS